MRGLKAGLDPERLVAVAVSHLHPDHTGDLPGLLFAWKQIYGDDRPLLLLGPEGLLELVEALQAPYGGWLDLPFEVRGYPAEIEGLLVEAFPADHAADTPEARCLRLTADGKALGYSGDSSDCEGLRAACRDADLALLECSSMQPVQGHMTPQDCRRVAQESGSRRVLLTHLGPDVETDLPMAEDGLVISL